MNLKLNQNDIDTYFGKTFKTTKGEEFVVTGIHSIGRKSTKRYSIMFLSDGTTDNAYGQNIRTGEIKKKSIDISDKNVYHREVKKPRVILAIGDIHAPFAKEGYLEFCKEMYDKYDCTDVVFLGDIIDNHFSSFHDIDPDGHGAGEELDKAINQIQMFYKTFNNAKVCLGNHDNIANRKVFSSGLSKRWIKSIGEVIGTPNWEYAEEHLIDGIIFTHGTGRKARARCIEDSVSVCQGHYHSESYIEHFVGSDGQRKFACQVGCGIDREAYAFAYGKHFKAPHINVAIINTERKTAILEYM